MIRVGFYLECDGAGCSSQIHPVIPRPRGRHQEEVMRIAWSAGWGYQTRYRETFWYCPRCVEAAIAEGEKLMLAPRWEESE